MNRTDITLTFRVPRKAIELLELIREQNLTVEFNVDKTAQTITIYSDLLDFLPYSNDWDDIEDFEDGELEEEK